MKMIYRIKEHKDKLIEKAYNEGMREFHKFFGINWTYNKPNVCVLENRKEIDFFNYKSQRWVVGFAKNNIIYVLKRKNMEKESSHKQYSPERYAMLVKHELCHLFYGIIAKSNSDKQKWLTEGVSIYLSGQMKFKKPVSHFSAFIDANQKNGNGAYDEGGEAVKLLVENFGKKKLLNLISKSKEVNTNEEFAKLFKKIYSFDLNYKNFNALLKK